MVKLLHLADLHIGVENYGRIDPATGLHTRLLDYLARLDEAFDLALAEGVDVVLIAGDIYKNRTPNPTHQREFAKRLRRITGNGIPVFIITGNHDVSPAAGRAHAVEIFNTLAVDGVTIADKPALHLLETPGGPLQIVALPWVSRHALLTRDDMKNASMQEVELELRRRVDYFIEETAAGLDRTVPAVFAFHGSVEGASPGAERTISLGSDMVVTRGVVAQPQFDYVALGHIHKHQVLGQHPPLVYPGSIERIDFGEEAEDKGCVLVELQPGEARWRFHKLAARPFITISADLRNSSDAEGRVAALIERRDLREAVVRVQLQATREQAATLREERVRELLEAANPFFIAAVSVEVPRAERGRFAAVEQELAGGLTPRRALELYLLSKNTAPERIAQLLATHDTLAAES